MKGAIIAAAIAVALGLGATCCLVVDETEQAVVTQFGRPVAVHQEAGLYWKLPAPVQRVVKFDKRTLLTVLDETELLTSDKKNVVVAAYLSWRIADPLRYLTAVRGRDFAEARLTALVQSELGSALGDLPFAELLPGPDEAKKPGIAELERAVHEASGKVARADFGIEITTLGLARLNFPPQNLQSVFARMRAERARIARAYRSEGEAEAEKIRAEADRESSAIVAEAEAEAARLRGQGEAEAAGIYANAYRGHERFYRFLRTLESYEKTLNENTTIVLPADSPFLELLTRRMPPLEGAR